MAVIVTRTITRLCYFSLLIFFAVVIVHICVLLLIPVYADTPLMDRLRQQNAGWQFATLDPDNPIATRHDPDFRLAVCHFDLEEAPVRLAAEGNVPFWSLSLYGSDANNLYSLNSRIMPGGKLDLVIGTPIQIMDYKRYGTDEQAFVEGQGSSILTQHMIAEGFVVLRAYVPSADWENLAEEFLHQAHCNKIDS